LSRGFSTFDGPGVHDLYLWGGAVSALLLLASGRDTGLPSVSINGRTLEAISVRRAARLFGAMAATIEMESEKQR
jgi:hypothetical protein